MLSRNYEFYLVITSYWPYGLPYQTHKSHTMETVIVKNKNS